MGDKLGSRRRSAGTQEERPFRWVLGGAGVATLMLLAASGASLAGVGTADASSAPAEGTSSAQSLQVTPHEGSLAVGAIVGSALAGVTGADAKAQSQGVDLGALGAAARGYNCGEPPNTYVYNAVPEPLDTQTGDPGAAQGITQGPSTQTNYGSTEYVQADATPYGEADTTYTAPVADPTGAFTASGMHSKAWAGIVNGVNETGASSDIAQLDLGNGEVVLDGLDWSTTSTESGQQSGTFTIGKVLIAGTPLPNVADLSAVAAAVNTALSNLGLVLGFPSSYNQQGYEFVGPLQIEVVPNATRDQVEQAIVDGAQPTYYQIANGLENGFATDSSPYNALGQAEQGNLGQEIEYGVNVNGNQFPGLCDSDVPIPVADVTIASLDGGGYFNAAVGGVTSINGLQPSNPFSLNSLGLGATTLGGSSQYIPGTLGTPGTTGTLAPAPTTPSTPPSNTLHEAVNARVAGYSPGGPLLAAALGGAGLLLLLIAGDRRLMRRAQRATLRSNPAAGPSEG